MREILFRGKRADNKWTTGYIYEHEPPLTCFADQKEKSKLYIFQSAFADWNMPRWVQFLEVDPETVGQWTGLHDKNGTKIYEGDIVTGHDLISRTACDFVGVVNFKNGSFMINCDPTTHYRWTDYDTEVIGNIHDNPELLEAQP